MQERVSRGLKDRMEQCGREREKKRERKIAGEKKIPFIGPCGCTLTGRGRTHLFPSFVPSIPLHRSPLLARDCPVSSPLRRHPAGSSPSASCQRPRRYTILSLLQAWPPHGKRALNPRCWYLVPRTGRDPRPRPRSPVDQERTSDCSLLAL